MKILFAKYVLTFAFVTALTISGISQNETDGLVKWMTVKEAQEKNHTNHQQHLLKKAVFDECVAI